MNEKLIVAFFNEIKESGSLSVAQLNSISNATHGQLFNFILELKSASLITIENGEITLTATNEQVADYKTKKLRSFNTYEEGYLEKVSKLIDDEEARVLDYVHFNPFTDMQEDVPTKIGVNPTLISGALFTLCKRNLIKRIGDEYFSLLSPENFEILANHLKDVGIDLEQIRKSITDAEYFDCLLTFEDFEYKMQADKSLKPVMLLNNAYLNCKDAQIKMKMREQGLHFLVYPSVLDAESSSFVFLDYGTPVPMDFFKTIVSQLPEHVSLNGRSLVFKVNVVLRKIN